MNRVIAKGVDRIGPLIVGQYSSNGPQYQVQGAVSGLALYHRALGPDEIAAAHQEGPPK